MPDQTPDPDPAPMSTLPLEDWTIRTLDCQLDAVGPSPVHPDLVRLTIAVPPGQPQGADIPADNPTPADWRVGWSAAAAMLRRTPRESPDYPGALRAARLIEDALRRQAADQAFSRIREEAPPVPVPAVRLGDLREPRPETTGTWQGRPGSVGISIR